jgi:hypothetical protein
MYNNALQKTQVLSNWNNFMNAYYFENPFITLKISYNLLRESKFLWSGGREVCAPDRISLSDISLC